jgi:hypothetical protein
MCIDQAEICSIANSSSPFFDSGILENVLSYVGLGHHLFVAPISKLWQAIYTTLGSHQLIVCSRNRRRGIVITCVPQMTFYSAAFASPSRVKLAHESGLSCTSTAYKCAAGKHADAATLATAHELGMQYTIVTMTDAAECNRLAEVQYLHNQGCPWPSGLLGEVASRGHFELLRWCSQHGCPWDTAMAPFFAAKSSSIELMAWVLQQPRTQLYEDVMYTAAAQGHTAMCQLLHAKQCPWDWKSTRAAARGGHADVLRWLMDNGCPWNAQYMCEAAARGGSVEVLVHLQQQGLLTSAALLRSMLNTAANCNQLAAAKWLREQGAEWPTALGGWHSEALA